MRQRHPNLLEVKKFLSHYQLGQFVSMREVSQQGYQSMNYVVETQKGTNILTIFNSRLYKMFINNAVPFMQRLANEGGLPVPRVQFQNDGRIYGRLQRGVSLMMSFMPGAYCESLSVESCRQVGDALGKMHQLGCDFRVTKMPFFPQAFIRYMHINTVDHIAPFVPNYRKMMKEEFVNFSQNFPRGFVSGTIHNDYRKANLLFSQDQLTGILDFYFLAYSALIWDLSLIFNDICFDEMGKYDELKAKSFMKAYTAYDVLPDKEWASFIKVARARALWMLMTDNYTRPTSERVANAPAIRALNIIDFYRNLTSFSELNI